MNPLLDKLVEQAVKKYSLTNYRLKQSNFLHFHFGPTTTSTFELDKRVRIIYGYTVSYFGGATDQLFLRTKSKSDSSEDSLYVNTTTTEMFIPTGSEHFGGQMVFETVTNGLSVYFVNIHYVDICPTQTMLVG